MSQNVGAGRLRRKKCARRNKADARATEIAADAQKAVVRDGHNDCSDRAIARAWDLESHHPVSELFSLTSGRSMSLGEPLALPRELGRRIYMGCLAEIDAETPIEFDPARLVLDVRHAAELLENMVRNNPRARERHRDAFLHLAAVAMRGYLAAGHNGAGR